MEYGWPQYTVIVLYIITLTINFIRHGELKPNHDYDFVWAVIGVCISVFLLKSGGFF